MAKAAKKNKKTIKNKDLLTRFLFENAPLRGEVINLQKSFQQILAQHTYPPALKKLLGEALCVAGLLSAIIKFKGRLTVQFRGKGALKFLLAQCDNDFNLRGLLKWEGDLSYDELMSSFSEGVLVIMLDSTTNLGRYQGIVAWRGNSLAESIEGYFQDSEQLKTKLWLSVSEEVASGFLLQIIPAEENQLEKDLSQKEWDRLCHLMEVKGQSILNDSDAEMILSTVYQDDDIRMFEPDKLTFKCTCTRKRGEDAIKILGRAEAEAELNQKEIIVVTCDFCNKEYHFTRAQITKLFKNTPSAGQSLH